MTKELNSPSTPEQNDSTNATQTTAKQEEKKTTSPQVNRFRFLADSCSVEAARFRKDDHNFDRDPGPIC